MAHFGEVSLLMRGLASESLGKLVLVFDERFFSTLSVSLARLVVSGGVSSIALVWGDIVGAAFGIEEASVLACRFNSSSRRK